MGLRRFTKEPISTFTNLSYVLFAAYKVWGQSIWIMEFYVILAALSLAVGSSLFHGRRKHVFQKVDETSMYGFLIALMVWNLGSVWFIPVGVAVSLAMGLNHQHISSTKGVGLLVIILIILTGLLDSWMTSLIATGIFVFAYLIRRAGEAAFDEYKVTTNIKEFWVYDSLHGIWHILTALAGYIILI